VSSDQRCADCGLWQSTPADRDPQNISDPRTDCGSIVDEKLRTRTDADPNPWLVIFITKYFENMNNFGCVLAVKCHCRYFVRLPTTKFRIWLFLAYCTAVRRLFILIAASRGLLLATACGFLVFGHKTLPQISYCIKRSEKKERDGMR